METEFNSNRIACRQFWNTMVGYILVVGIDVDAIQFGTSHLQLNQQILSSFLAYIANGNVSFDGEI